MSQYLSRRVYRKRSEVWQTIYMDLMTIIMVFFVILWSINQENQTGTTESIGDQMARMVTLPADILFPSGKADMTVDGSLVFARLFADDTGSVLNFDTGGLTRRLLLIHGHTDSDGIKDKNFLLGYERAYAAYKEIQRYGADVADHVILCTHADNSPAEHIPEFQGELTVEQREALRAAKAENRRITLEDKIMSTLGEE